jgi:hypothetical protein
VSDAEIKATASLDDKLTPALNRVEANVKKSSDSMEGHLKKFAFNADDFTSKLARSFSAVDIAAGVAAGAIVAMGAKTEQVYNKALKAFVESNDAARESLKRFEDAIHKNDESIGRAAFKLEMLRKEIELFASGGTAKGVAVINAVASAAMAIAKYGLGGNDQRGKGSTGSGGASGAGVGPPFDPNPDPSAINRRTEAAYQAMIDARASARTSAPSIDPDFYNKVNLGGIAGLRGGMFKMPDMFAPKEPDISDPWEENAKRLKASYDKMQGYTNTLAQGLSATFSGMLFDGMKLSDGLKGIFRGLVDDILGELSAKAASSIVKAVLTLADTGGGAVGVQVGPAAMNTTLQTLDYQRARGR